MASLRKTYLIKYRIAPTIYPMLCKVHPVMTDHTDDNLAILDPASSVENVELERE